MKNELKDIKNYINQNGVSQYTTKEVLDMINDKNIDREQLKGIKRSLIFNSHINLSKLVKDHQWYFESLKATPKATQKATRKEAPKVTPKATPKATQKVTRKEAPKVTQKEGWVRNPNTKRLIQSS